MDSCFMVITRQYANVQYSTLYRRVLNHSTQQCQYGGATPTLLIRCINDSFFLDHFRIWRRRNSLNSLVNFIFEAVKFTFLCDCSNTNLVLFRVSDKDFLIINTFAVQGLGHVGSLLSVHYPFDGTWNLSKLFCYYEVSFRECYMFFLRTLLSVKPLF